jgi:hypothetical protein
MKKTVKIAEAIFLDADADWDDLSQISLAQWQRAPVLHSGQYDNLVFENDRFRVWVSRSHLTDYNGDAEAYSENRFTIEKLINGRWKNLDRYGMEIKK